MSELRPERVVQSKCKLEVPAYRHEHLIVALFLRTLVWSSSSFMWALREIHPGTGEEINLILAATPFAHVDFKGLFECDWSTWELIMARGAQLTHQQRGHIPASITDP